METKRCWRCKEDKPLSEFGRDRSKRDGLNTCCKACKKLINAEQREYRNAWIAARGRKRPSRQGQKKSLERREYEREYSRSYRMNNPQKARESCARYYDRLHENGGKITSDDLQECLRFFNNECAYSGVPLTSGNEFDHVVPVSKGGGSDIHNIVPCLATVNRQKWCKTLEEWYPKQPFYSEERHKRIVEWMNMQ